MPTPPQNRRRRGLFVLLALLSTLLILLSIGTCAFLFIRHQKAEMWRALEAEARTLSETIAKYCEDAPEEAAESVAQHCQRLFSGPTAAIYATVLRKGTGDAIVHTRNGWRRETAAASSTAPRGSAKVEFSTGVSPENGEPVLECTHQFGIGTLPLGHVRLGMSLTHYQASLDSSIRSTLITLGLASLAGVAGSFFLAKRITQPLQKLCDMTSGIAAGNLASRAAVSSSAEVQHLADHLNWMAASLESNAATIQAHQRDLEESNQRLRERVENEQLLSRISADFLFSECSAPNEIFPGSLERIARRLNIDGAAIFLHQSTDHSVLHRVWEWHTPAAPDCSLERVPVAGFPWATALASGRNVVDIADCRLLPAEAAAEKVNFERLGIRSAATALLGSGDKASGYLFLRNQSPRSWSEEEKQLILLAAGIFSNAIARRDAAVERERLQGQLLQAQKMEAVGKLSGGIAHDFNNMLVPIVGYSDSILNAAPEDAPWVNEIREIKRSAESAASLTRQLLSFSRKQIISRKEMDLNSHVQKLQHMLRRLIGENIKLHTELAPDLWTTAADAGQIEQCLLNLAVNARAAMPDGGSIYISTEMMDSEDAKFSPPPLRKIQGLFIRLTLRDTGCGMDAGTLTRIFEPFFSTKGEEGTGLGLSVVYGVMEEHGGWVTVDSTPGKGTAFHLWLPALHEPTPQPMDTGLTIAQPLPRGNGQRILLIEDEPGVLSFVSSALRQHGYYVITADSGIAARSIFNGKPDEIDLVMSDVVLPDTTGVELLHEFFILKPELRALLSSGYSEKQSLVELVEKHGLYFLHKPYTLIQLLEAVHGALKGRSRSVLA